MEAFVLDVLAITFAAAFAGVLVLLGVIAGIAFGYMATEERTGTRLTWAEWPLPERVEHIPAEEERIRLAA